MTARTEGMFILSNRFVLMCKGAEICLYFVKMLFLLKHMTCRSEYLKDTAVLIFDLDSMVKDVVSSAFCAMILMRMDEVSSKVLRGLLPEPLSEIKDAEKLVLKIDHLGESYASCTSSRTNTRSL